VAIPLTMKPVVWRARLVVAGACDSDGSLGAPATTTGLRTTGSYGTVQHCSTHQHELVLMPFHESTLWKQGIESGVINVLHLGRQYWESTT
jgi:hypothetical protein